MRLRDVARQLDADPVIEGRPHLVVQDDARDAVADIIAAWLIAQLAREDGECA